MKLGIGLAAAFMAAVMATSASADDAAKAAKATAAAAKKAAAQVAQGRPDGMKNAPAAVAAKGLPCTVTDATKRGETDVKDADGKKVHTNVYEVACQDSFGYLLMDKGPDAYSCPSLATSASPCVLPGNESMTPGLTNYMQKAGVSCSATQGRLIGSNLEAKYDLYEVACSDGSDYNLTVPQLGSTSKIVAENCLDTVLGAPNKMCTYLTKENAVASLAPLVAKSGKPCNVSDARYVGSNSSTIVYEIACGPSGGFMLETDNNRVFRRAIDCGLADNVGGGCTLTHVSVAGDTQDIGIYQRAADKIGYPCKISKYRSLGAEGKNEIVEVACSDHPDGGFMVIPIDGGPGGETYNCIRSEARQQICKLTSKSLMYDNMSEQLARKGKQCKVVNTRGIGKNQDGSDVVEAKCDNGTGYVVIFAKGLNLVSQALTCAEGAKAGASCAL